MQLEKQKKHLHVKLQNMKVKIQSEYCGGPIRAKPKILEFTNFQRFFCCIGCKKHYKEKHEGTIRSIVEQYKEMQKRQKSNMILVETDYRAPCKSPINNMIISMFALVIVKAS
jgi:hypothetical protein